jgi:hypothetical protein
VTEFIASHFDKQEAQVIARAPVLVFLLVSAADGTIDKREIEDFESILTGPSYGDLLAVMNRAKLSIVDTLRQLTESPVDYLDELRQIARVLACRLPANLTRQIKCQLYELGRHVTASSGGTEADSEDALSTQEQVALKVIAGLFDID